jgi:hypothetical protein
VAGEVVGDHAVVLGDLLVLQEAPPLVVVATGGVLADERLARSILQEEDLALVAHDVDRDVVARHR